MSKFIDARPAGHTLTGDTPFIDYALQHAGRYPGRLDTPHHAVLLALAAMAEHDSRTGNGVPRGYSPAQVAAKIGRSESSTYAYLRKLHAHGLVERVSSGSYRPHELNG